MDRSAKLRKLNDLRRSLPHCSASAFGAIMEAARDEGVPEDVSAGRNNLRAARDQQNSESTPFGPILQSINLIDTNDAERGMHVAHPLALLWTAVHCKPFGTYLGGVLRENPPSPEAPWNLVIYSDEVTPGNPLSNANKRKFHAIYWSFLELGSHALSREESWFCIVTEYSKSVNAFSAGLSQVFGAAIKLFFDPNGVNLATTGMLLPGIDIRLWAQLGGVLQDGGAHKSVWHSRGDAASRFCLLCKNIFTEESRICEEDGSRMLCCNVLKLAGLAQATGRDVRAVARHIQAQQSVLNPQQFRELQQALGMTHHPHGLLLDRTLDTIVDPVAVYMHDWMHALCVDGVCNVALYLLFEGFITVGHSDIYVIFSNYLANWVWPGRLGTSVNSMPDIFSETRKANHRKAQHVKCQASDMLSLLPVAAVFTSQVLMKLEPRVLRSECIAFLALVDVVDLIVASSRITVPSVRLLQAVEKFLELFNDAWGVQWMVPKFHWLLHIPGVLHKHGKLLNCFCLERKHRVPKRYATELKNTSDRTKASLLKEVTSHQLAQLNDDAAFSFAVGLVRPIKQPSKHLKTLLGSRLNINCAEQHVVWSNESRFSKLATCMTNDVVIFKHGDAGEVKAGIVHLHLEVEGVAVSSVTVLSPAGAAEAEYSVWTSSEFVHLIETPTIVDTVVHSKLANGRVAIILPLEFRK